MRVIDCDWKKRNGNGHSTCHLCNTLSLDSFCYDFELKILDKELFNTVLCGDCISKIRNELECKMPAKEEMIEEVEDKKYEDIEENNDIIRFQNLSTPYGHNEQMFMKYIVIQQNKINALIRNQKKIIEKINNNE